VTLELLQWTRGDLWRHGWRSASACLVLLLHLFVIWLLLLPRLPRPQRTSQIESVLVLAPLKKPASTAHHHAMSAPLSLPPWQISPPAFLKLPPQTKSLGLSLFGCAPENLQNLSPDQRMHCKATIGAFAAGDGLGEVRERSADANRWAAAIAKRNTPVAVPCTYTENVTAGFGTAPAAMVDLVCLERMIMANQ
jgi:hypothetical protein